LLTRGSTVTRYVFCASKIPEGAIVTVKLVGSYPSLAGRGVALLLSVKVPLVIIAGFRASLNTIWMLEVIATLVALFAGDVDKMASGVAGDKIVKPLAKDTGCALVVTVTVRAPAAAF